jgi:hypothetical protein
MVGHTLRHDTMSFAQIALAALWLQLPIGGVALLCSHDLVDWGLVWARINVAFCFLAVCVWTLNWVVINWASLA